MKPFVLLLSLVAVALPAYGQAPALAQRKPGLWELQYSVTGTTDEARKSEEMRRRLEQMPPEKRAQMEEYRQRTGMGMTMGPNGPVMNMRFCLTPEDIRQESGRALLHGVDGSDCKRDVAQRSASEVRIHAVCGGNGGAAAEVEARIHDIAPDHYAVDMDSRSAKGEIHMMQKARWLGADCARTP